METSRVRRPGRPTSQEADAIDRAIEEAVLAEAASGCMSEISIERIAARAGVTRTAIYRRFAGRQALLRAAIAARVNYLRLRIEVCRADAGTPLEGLRRTLHVLMRESNSVAGLDLKRLIIATGPHDGLVRADLLEAQRTFKAICDDAITAVMQEATPKGYSVPDLRELLLDTLATGRTTAALAVGSGMEPEIELDRVFELRWQTLEYLFQD